MASAIEKKTVPQNAQKDQPWSRRPWGGHEAGYEVGTRTQLPAPHVREGLGSIPFLTSGDSGTGRRRDGSESESLLAV